MKVSVNWIQEFLDFDLPPVDELVEKIGAQLAAVETVTDLGTKYKGIVVARVVSCDKIADSDHLNVCKIDDGGVVQGVERDDQGRVQVVCGAPNVHTDLLVAWLPPGTTVPSTYNHEPLVLEARDIRGVTSNGMLASPKELAVGDSHEGLLIIDTDCLPGAQFAEIYKLNDHIIELENKMFTHRPDCFGILGIAREIAGILGHKFTSPQWYQRFDDKAAIPSGTSLPLTIVNEIPDLVPRFMAVAIANVAVKSSSVYVQSYLNRVGVRPINNIVDITNYMMLLTGQPLHAYDYDKVLALSDGDSAAITVRHPHAQERLTLLNGKEIEPLPDAIVIATNKQAIGLGGVMGGANTEVDTTTKNIILECASFDMYSIRRTSMTHGIFSDAVTRFTKGQSPLQNDRVILESGRTICDVTGGEFAGAMSDDRHFEDFDGSLHQPVRLKRQFINQRLGLELTDEVIIGLLTNTEFGAQIQTDEISVKAPFWRTDIELREDVVEEVGRLYGYDKLPLALPHRDLMPASKDPLLELKSRVRHILSAAGANEILTYSFVHGDLLEKAGQKPSDAFRLNNALSPDLQYYRLSLTPSLLNNIHPNVKAGYNQFVLFELGKGHNLQQLDEDGLPVEFEMLDVVYAATAKVALAGAAYYQAREYLVNLAASFGLQLEFRPFTREEDYPVVKPYDHRRSAQVFVKGTDIALGMIGEYKASVAQKFKLPKYCAGFGIGLTQLLMATKAAGRTYVVQPRFPKVQQDMTLRVPANLLYSELFDFIWQELAKVQPEQTLPSFGPVDIYQRDDDPEHKQITLRLTIASYHRTMTDAEVNKLLDEVAAAAKETYGAERV